MINSIEVENVLKLDNLKKYEYFIKKVADYEEVWSLKDSEGWASLGKDDMYFFPIWPKKEFAKICASDEWKGYKAEKIELNEFLEDWIDGLKEDGIRITVMWNNGNGIDIEWEKLKKDIEEELNKY